MRLGQAFSWKEDSGATSGDQQIYNRLQQRAAYAAEETFTKAIDTFTKTYFSTIEKLTSGGAMSSYQLGAIAATQQTAQAMGAAPIIGGALGSMFGPAGMVVGAGVGGMLGGVVGGYNQVFQAQMEQAHQNLVVSQSLLALGAVSGTNGYWNNGGTNDNAQSVSNTYNTILQQTLAASPTAYNIGNIKNLQGATSSNEMPYGNAALTAQIVAGGLSYQSAFPGLQGQNIPQATAGWFHPTNNARYDPVTSSVPRGDPMGLMNDQVTTMTRNGNWNALNTDPATRAAIVGAGIYSDTDIRGLMMGGGNNPADLAQSGLVGSIANEAALGRGRKSQLGVSISGAASQASGLASAMQGYLTRGKDLFSAAASMGMDPNDLIASMSEDLAGAQHTQIGYLGQMAGDLSKNLAIGGSQMPKAQFDQETALLASINANIASLTTDIKQNRVAAAGVGFGLGMGQAGVMGSEAGISEAMAALYGGPGAMYAVRGQQMGALGKSASSLSSYMESGNLAPDVYYQKMSQLNDVISQQITLYQKAGEEFYGMSAAIAGTRGSTAMIGGGNLAAAGYGPSAAIGVSGPGLGLQNANISRLQSEANLRYSAIIANGEDPMTNQAYQGMLNNIAAQQGQLISYQNSLAAPQLSAQSRLTTSSAVFQQNVAQMLPGTGVSMYQNARVIANQANQNIQDLSTAYRQEVADNGGIETPEMRLRHQMQIMDQMQTQVSAISSVTTGIEGRMIQASTNMGSNVGMVDPTFSRRAAYGAGFNNVPFYTGMGSTPGDLRGYSGMLGRTTSFVGSDINPEQGNATAFGGALRPQPVTIQGPMQMELWIHHADGSSTKQTATARNIGASAIGPSSGEGGRNASLNQYGGATQR